MPKRMDYVQVNGNGLQAEKSERTQGPVYADLKRGEWFKFTKGHADYTGDARVKSQTKGFICPVTGTRYRQEDMKAPITRLTEVNINWS